MTNPAATSRRARSSSATMLVLAVAALAIGGGVGFVLARSGPQRATGFSVARGTPRTGYQPDDPVRLQPLMRALVVSMVAIQGHLDRGFPRPAESFVQAMLDTWAGRPRGNLDPHAYGPRFDFVADYFEQQARLLLRATREGTASTARQAYTAVVAVCMTCHHQAERGDGVNFGRLGAGFSESPAVPPP